MPHLASAAVAPARPAAILLVDDAPAQLGALRSMMLEQGYQSFIANSGERALPLPGAPCPT
ncbi:MULTISPECIES: hypothetical protein [unclassified Massilia]|uniref:hypothetical protein n=1 Tax=unclassified Massilia TaxID=2609279 RepID=UPI0018612843|nr:MULTISPECIES: hypothetical protein [unclassified Massilia]QNB00516.1 hypothetical protein G4G31_19710 [Massilia sp. Se16.2.3]